MFSSLVRVGGDRVSDTIRINVGTIRINVGPPTRDFIGEIADALACWDHPGMPSIGELSEEMQAAYRELAEWFLNHGKERVMAETMMDISADDLLYEAWAVIANAGWDGADKSEGWQEAAVRWRDKWHAYLEDSRPDRSE